MGIQPTLRRICGCSFLPHHDYGRGGRGWRDLWQDSLALLLTDPAGTRGDLLSYFAGVRTDGTNATIIGTKPGEFKADRNNIPRVWMDHGFWPLLTVELYLNETGDRGFLLEQAPYFRDTLPHRGEGAPLKEPGAPKTGTVLEHLLIQAVTAFFDVNNIIIFLMILWFRNDKAARHYQCNSNPFIEVDIFVENPRCSQ